MCIRDRDELGRVTDVCGEELAVYPAAREALKMIHTHEAFEGTRVAVASRTNRAQWAREAMKLQVIAPGVTLQDVAGDLAEIYPGSKRKHLASLREKTGVPTTACVSSTTKASTSRRWRSSGSHRCIAPEG